MVSAASFALTLSIKSCTADKETVSGPFVSERKITLVLAQ